MHSGAHRGSNPNGPTLERGLELMSFFREDAQHLAARDLHDLLRCWEVWDRIDSAEACLRHSLQHPETKSLSPGAQGAAAAQRSVIAPGDRH